MIDSIDDTCNDEDEEYCSDYEYEDAEDEDEKENNFSYHADVTVVENNAMVKNNKDTVNFKTRLQKKYQLVCEAKRVNDCHASDLTGKKKAIVKENIFSANASFQVLLNDFVALNNESAAFGYAVDVIDDNIFTWRVVMTKFHPDTNIAFDLAILDSRWEYSYVELQISFAMDLYPFFPPIVTIVRPRIEGSMLSKIATLKMLQLDNWDPVKGVRAVLDHIRDELERNGRVLVDNPYNCITNHPEGAYSELESLLLKLSLVNETVPRIHQRQLLSENTTISLTKSIKSSSCSIRNNSDSSNNISDSNSDNNKKRNIVEFLPYSQLEPGNKKPSSTSTSTPTSPSNYITIKSSDVQYQSVYDYSYPAIPSAIIDSNGYLHNAEEVSSAATHSLDITNKLTDVKISNNNNNSENYGSKYDIPDSSENNNNTKTTAPSPPIVSGDKAIVSNTTWAKWSMNHYLAAQAEKDNLQKKLLTDVLKALRKETALVRETTTTIIATATTNNNIRNNTINNDQSDIGIKLSYSLFHQATDIAPLTTTVSTPIDSSLPPAAAPAAPWDYIWIAIESSSLLPTLEQFLCNESLLDIERHEETYKLCFEILSVFCENKELHSLLFPLPAQKISIAELAEKISDRIRVYSKQFCKQTYDSTCFNSFRYTWNRQNERNNAAATTATNMIKDNSVDNEFMTFVQEVLLEIHSLYVNHCSLALRQSHYGDSSAASSSPSPWSISTDIVTSDLCTTTTAASTVLQSIEEIYVAAMKPLQYDDIEFTSFHFQSHHEMTYLPTSSQQGRTRRLAQEHVDLQQSLPLSLSSSVWIRASTSRIDALQVLISGPDDTPYANGLFHFDVIFPSRYPAVPPLVNLQTTGQGSVRFNPNLYKDGKVCLSLLGTWSGREGETWNAATSTFLQVLVSIQSLIFVRDPYFNEPGFEYTMGTEAGLRVSRRYNDTICEETLRWAIINTIENPLKGFEEVINIHFKLKKDIILTQITNWIEGAKLSKSQNLPCLEGLSTKFIAVMKKYEE